MLAAIAEKKILDDDVKEALKAALEDFGKQFAASRRRRRTERPCRH